MMTIATINGTKDCGSIDFDMDDSGNYYLKQGDDWIVLNALILVRLCQAIEKQLERL